MTTVLPRVLRFITAAALVLGLAPSTLAGEPARPPGAPAAPVAARAALKAAPAPGTSGSGFVANQGQWDAEVLFMAPIEGGRAWVTASGIVYDFTKAVKRKQGERDPQPPSLKEGPMAAKAGQAERVQGHVVRLDFAAAALPKVRPGAKLKTRLNYFVGNDASKHAANVRAYAAVSLEGLWQGVDLRLAQGPGGFELSFHAVDAAALAAARVFVDGASLVSGSGAGAVVGTSLGQRSLGSVGVTLGSARYAGQLLGGAVALAPGRTVVEAQAAAASESGAGLVYSTFLGGSDYDSTAGLAVDASGAAFVAGSTESSNFPTTPGAYDRTHNGGDDDLFVTKLSADGSALVYSTFLGGRGEDYGRHLAVDASGAAYVSGMTESTDFPTTPGAFDRSYNGGVYDAFVTKLSADGSALVYSTFLGGSLWDSAGPLVVDASGVAYVAGYTQSSDFSTTPGAFDTTYNGSDAFVTKLSADGSALVYATFLGGSDYDSTAGLVVDASGAAYVAGETWSSDFPTTPGAYRTTGSNDAFAAKLSADGTALVYSTLLGGGGDDGGGGLAVDASGTAYLTGYTDSADFPTTPGAFNRAYNGGSYDAFVTRLSADGSALVYSTFLGGNAFDGGGALAVDASGAAYLTGWTESRNFPTAPGAYDSTHNGGYYDAFVAKLSADGSSLAYATFLGGESEDYGTGLAVDASGTSYVTGYTQSSNFPTTRGAYDSTHNNPFSTDAFVTKLDVSGVASGVVLSATATPTTVAAGGSFTVTYIVSNNKSDPVTGDLGYTAVRNGNLVAQGRVLTDTTVAAHGAITGSFMLAVPGNARPGVYTYTVRIGRTPGGTKDKVAFKITVTDPAQAGVVPPRGRR